MSKFPFEQEMRVTQVYKPGVHLGIDLVGLKNWNVITRFGGKVVRAEYDTVNKPESSYGNVVIIHGDDGLFYLYAHLDKMFVKQMDVVYNGDVIGIMGSTGHSTGAHLHFEIRKTFDFGSQIDPASILGIPNLLGVYQTEADMNERDVVDLINKIVFNGEKDPSTWAKESWNEAKEIGITDGTKPKSVATRQEVAKMITNAMQILKEGK